jgi:hypothetical protein
VCGVLTGEYEAAAANFGLAIKEGHLDLWECWFLRGLCCARYGAAEDGLAAFTSAIGWVT